MELTASMAISGMVCMAVAGAYRGMVERGVDAKCKMNLHVLASSAIAYAYENDGEFPWAMDGYGECWDFKTAGATYEPGLLYEYTESSSILMCPKCAGEKDNWAGGGFTGYNYNTSYAGKCRGDMAERTTPSGIDDFPSLEHLALFGDAGYGDPERMNKFMRAPKSDKEYDGSGSAVRKGGTQSFRHLGHANIAFADGHVESIRQSYRQDGSKGFVSGHTGFIDSGNGLYSGLLRE